MTENEIKARVKTIRDSKGDYEAAHGMEDKLVWDFIRSIPKQFEGEIAKKAKLVLASSYIHFPRHCA